MSINRSWIENFYTECGREVSLAYNVLNHTNTWGITLTSAVVLLAFLSSIETKSGVLSLHYPTLIHLYIVIICWVIMCRFFVRSCLAYTNMHRWNTLISATSKVLSLDDDHPDLPVYQNNFIKKVKAYYYDWNSPIPQWKIIWNNLKLMYLWFFLILFALIIWGFVQIDHDLWWKLGFPIFIFPTLLELWFFKKWYGLNYKSLEQELEDEKDITELWLNK